jgi:DNA-binding transcriptional LysR family regulator
VDLLAAMTTFVRVADAGSLSKAARTLRVTPAAVSRQLTALEGELGASLIVRTTRRLALTDEGRRFYEHAERTVHEADEARAAVREDRAVVGRVTISMPTAMVHAGLDAALAELVAGNPGLEIDLRLEDHPVDLLADGIDVAIRAGLVPPDSTTLVAQPLAMLDRAVACAPGYIRRRGEPRTPGELAHHDALVHLHAGNAVGIWQLHRGDELAAVTVRGRLRATALHVLRDAAIEGAGIALLPRFLVVRGLRALPLGGWQPRPQQIYALVRVESKNRARVRAVIEAMHARLMVVQDATDR